MIENKLSMNVTSAIIADSDFVYSHPYESKAIFLQAVDTFVSQFDLFDYAETKEINCDYKVEVLERLIYSLLKEGNLKEAKCIIEEFKCYSSPLLDKWQKALTRPSKKNNKIASLKKGEMENDFNLISRYREKYRNQWVALVGNKIIASNNSLSGLKKQIKTIDTGDDITFLKL